jgi:hypothetical protein
MTCTRCEGETEHFHCSGRWKCAKCGNFTARDKKEFRNTNKNKGDDRGYDASGEAHSIIAKGSHRMIRRR